MNKKRILFLIYNLNGGGAEKVLLKVLEKINLNKFKVDLFLIKKEGVYVEYFEKNYKEKISLITPYDNLSSNIILQYFQKKIIHKQVRRSLKRPINFRKFIKNKYDTMISFLEGMSTIYLSEIDCENKIAWIHADLQQHRLMTFEKERAIYSKYNKIICVSNQVKESFLKLYPENKEKLEVIYNPIDSEEIIKKSQEEIEEFRNKIFTFISVGRLVKEKGFDILLKAHKLLLEEGVLHNIIILGEGSERESLENYIRENKLENSIKLLGFKSNPYPYIKNADAYILSSRYEGYPLVLCEALVLNKKIISTDCTGAVEVLENGKYGLIVKREDEFSLKEGMKKIILSKEYEKKNFDIKKIIDKIEKIFENDNITALK
ncbi:glycosyltransferase [Fusobacterium mortiferum]|uniref:glycosyltransferase n=1 Tax=Fusobacterium mortiferum TaxID=850 RepID=UPI003F8DAC1A